MISRARWLGRSVIRRDASGCSQGSREVQPLVFALRGLHDATQCLIGRTFCTRSEWGNGAVNTDARHSWCTPDWDDFIGWLPRQPSHTTPPAASHRDCVYQQNTSASHPSRRPTSTTPPIAAWCSHSFTRIVPFLSSLFISFSHIGIHCYVCRLLRMQNHQSPQGYRIPPNPASPNSLL